MIYAVAKSGTKIDSLDIYPTAGADEFQYTKNTIIIFPDKRIELIDSTDRVNVGENVPIEERGTRKLTVTTSQFEITDKGKFEKISN